MYINTTLLKEYQLTPANIVAFQIISQLRFDDKVDEMDVASIISLLPPNDERYITKIKGTKDQDGLLKLRLTSEGKKVLENCQVPKTTKGDLDMAEYLMGQYLQYGEDRKLGSKNKIKEYVTITRNYLGLSLHQFYYLCLEFLSEYKFTQVLEYVFFNNNKFRYGKFINHIDDSPLVQWYEENKEYMEKIFSQKIK